MGFDELTDELYAGPLAGFVRRRDELAREAKSGGDAELAARVRSLRKPTVGASYLNMAARSGLLSLRELLALGGGLRTAQSSGDFAAVRTLAAKRNPLVTRVLHDLAAHLATLGVGVSASALDEVRSTLAGALADPEVAALVEQGRLDGPRAYAGFGDLAFAVPTPPAPVVQAPDADMARRDLDAAEADLATADQHLHRAEDEVKSAREHVEALTAELARRQSDLAEAERTLTQAAESRAAASARVEDARARTL